MTTRSILILFKLIVLVISQSNTGIRIAVNQNLVDNIKNDLIPRINPLLSNLTIPEKTFNIGVENVADLEISITHTNFQIQPVGPDNLQINFIDPQTLSLDASGIQGMGSTNLNIKFMIASDVYQIDLFIYNLGFSSKISLSRIESSKYPGKYIPSFEIETLNIQLDLDFDIVGDIIADIIDIVKAFLRKQITNFILEKINPLISQAINDELYDLTNNFPEVINVNSQIGLDYSLTSDPEIINNYLILSISGQALNLNSTEGADNQTSIQNPIPKYENNSLGLQIYFSEFSLNSISNAFFQSNGFFLKLNQFPSFLPFTLNMQFMNRLFEGIEKYYPADSKCQLIFMADPDNSPPNFSLTPGNIQVQSRLIIKGRIMNSNNIFEDAVVFSTNFSFKLTIKLNEGGLINGRIDQIRFTEPTLISSTKDINVNVEGSANYLTILGYLILGDANDKLSDLKIQLPGIDGINIDQSEVVINQGYVSFLINPQFK